MAGPVVVNGRGCAGRASVDCAHTGETYGAAGVADTGAVVGYSGEVSASSRAGSIAEEVVS